MLAWLAGGKGLQVRGRHALPSLLLRLLVGGPRGA